MLKVKTLVFNSFQVNCHIIYSQQGECILVDPSCYEPKECEQLVTFLAGNNLKPILAINTHCHIDHILGNSFVSEKYKIKVKAHERDMFYIDSAVEYGNMFGISLKTSPKIDEFVNDNDTIVIENEQLTILHTPGHTPGGISIYNKEGNFVLTGDTLFQANVGRTDLPGGNFNALSRSIKEKLYSLPDGTIVYCGHGIPTTIGFEAKNNPFVKK